jgi:hypothetical protein
MLKENVMDKRLCVLLMIICGQHRFQSDCRYNACNFVTGTESQSSGDLSSDRTVMHSTYAGVPTVKSEVKEETDTDSDVKPAPLHCVAAGMSLIFYW